MPSRYDTGSLPGMNSLADVLVVTLPGRRTAKHLRTLFPELVVAQCVRRTDVHGALQGYRPSIVFVEAYASQVAFCLAQDRVLGLEWVHLTLAEGGHTIPVTHGYEVTVSVRERPRFTLGTAGERKSDEFWRQVADEAEKACADMDESLNLFVTRLQCWQRGRPVALPGSVSGKGTEYANVLSDRGMED